MTTVADLAAGTEETMTREPTPSPDDAADPPAIQLVAPMPGLPHVRRLAVTPLDETGVLLTLRSLDDADVRLVAAASVVLFPDYVPEIGDEWVEAIGLSSADDALVLVVVTVGDSPAASTANLLAPIVVHRETGAAAQVVLAGADHPLRAPLVA